MKKFKFTLISLGLISCMSLAYAAPAAEKKGAAAPASAAGADPLADLLALGTTMASAEVESGGSIRAKLEPETAEIQRITDPRNVLVSVESVKRGTFPLAAIKVRVLKASQEGTGKEVKTNDILFVVPTLKTASGQLDMSDEMTRINAGSFYARRGDKMVVQLDKKEGTVWKANYLERK